MSHDLHEPLESAGRTPHRARRIVGATAFALWTLALLVAYHFTWGARFHPLLVQGPRMVVLLAMLVASWALGTLILRLVQPAAEALVPLRLALGFAGFAFLWLILALAGMLHPLVAWLLLLAGAAWGSLLLIRLPWPRRFPEVSPSLLVPLLLQFAGVLIALPMAFTPPTSTDELSYHLALPKWYIDAGEMITLPRYAFAAFPGQMEMLYTWALLLGQPIVAKLLHFSMGLIAAAFVAAWSGRIATPFAGVAAAAVLLTTPVILLNMSWAWLDVATALFVVLGTAAFLRLSETSDRREAICAGILWGMALGLKYTVTLYFGLAALVALWPYSRRRLREQLGPFLLAGLIAVALFSPYLVRNAVVYGNPTHPIGNQIWGPAHEGAFNRILDEVERRDAPLDYLRGAVSYTLWNRWADDSPGPVYLLALPVLLLVPLGSVGRKLYAIAALAMLILSIGFGGSVRYQIPAFFLLAIPIGIWLAGWWRSGILQRVLVMIVLLLPALSNLAFLAYHNRELFDPVEAALGFISEEDYLRIYCKNYPVLEYLNRQTPENARVLVIADQRLYYLDRPMVAASAFDVSPARDLVRASASATALGELLRRQGFSYVLFDRSEFMKDLHHGRHRRYWTDEELERLRQFFATIAEPVMKHGSTELYRVP